jgi:hypothetical protein
VNVLWLTTKSPWPPTDGGRLLQALTLEALRVRGVVVSVLAPLSAGDETSREEAAASTAGTVLLEVRRRRPLELAWAARPGALPAAIARHHHRAVLAEVERRVAAGSVDLVHVEQVHAFANAEPALAAGLPVVLRAQNVESDLWRGAVRLLPVRGAPLALEGLRLAAWEGRAVRRATATVALTAPDAARLARLGRLAPGAVRVVPAPFPASLPSAGAALGGEPPVVLFGSGGWLPNRDAARWFLRSVWPLVHRRLPRAVLHWFAGASAPSVAGVEVHAAPADSARAYAPGSILVLPLRLASGVRMRILEAWARGVPVVATAAAAAGLDAAPGRNLLLADRPEEFAAALAELAGDPHRRAGLAAEGRRTLEAAHDPAAVAARLEAIYAEAAAAAGVTRSR